MRGEVEEENLSNSCQIRILSVLSFKVIRIIRVKITHPHPYTHILKFVFLGEISL